MPIALIADASKGAGQLITEIFAMSAYDVIVVARDAEALEKCKAALGDAYEIKIEPLISVHPEEEAEMGGD